MKEQVITPRMAPRAAGKNRASGIAQKPARRDRPATGNRAHVGTLRKVLAYLPLAGKITLAIVAGVLLFAGYRAAASASFFEARSVDINPTTRASAEEITRVVRRAAAQSGVWKLDLAAVSAEIERLPWVRTAVVSRVLPDGLRVRVTERQPLAVVRLLSSGKVVWVSEDAVILDAVSSSDRLPTFFIRGWDERETENAQADNLARIQKYVELLRDWDSAGLSERVSEINLTDLDNVRVQLAGEDAQIEIRFLGDKNVSQKLKPALDELDARRDSPCGQFINYLLVKPNNGVIVGTEPGKPRCGGDGTVASVSDATATDRAQTNVSATAADKPATRKPEAQEKNRRSEKSQGAKKEQDKKEEARQKTKGETRPRRVG